MTSCARMPPADWPQDVAWLESTNSRALPGFFSDEMVAMTTLQKPDGSIGTKADETKCKKASVYVPYATMEYLPNLNLPVEGNERISILWTAIENAMVGRRLLG